ncbi:SAV_2336 N-terminal domain-related protein, partial [Streptomyces sp. NPDC059454]|uniref:SAV_2336 N-terminal domain-related protein n=1 Tax=Streptomyces sp. NPDC059454 TaxID=3346836 RepID=UPI0036B6E9AF
MSSGAAGSGEPDELRVARLYAALRDAGVELSPRELSDALWLALHTPRNPAGAAAVEPAPAPRSRPAPAVVPRPEPRERGRTAQDASRRPVHPFTRTRDGGAPGAPLRIPGVRGLRHPLGVIRGLRALKRRVPSPHRQELDETATAEATADSGVLDAVLRPARDRWLHLLLAVDDGPSLRVWRDTVGELADALTGSGIFRSVRVSPLDASALLTNAPTVVLALSDGVSDHWYDGSAHRRLAALARRAPTAVLHLLPTRLWSGTGLAAEPATVRTTGPAPPNSLLAVSGSSLPAASDPRPKLPVPVLELEELSLRPWADLIASHGGVAALRVIDVESPPCPGPDGDGGDAVGGPGTATDRVRTFRATASPAAYELAGHLAAVDPLTLPVMRLVQAAALPDSGPACLAEVMLSGLLHVDAPLDGHDAFAFAPEVRGVLRTVVRAGSAQRTVDAVSDFIVPRLGRTPDFPAVIADRTGTLGLPRGGEPLAELVPAGEPYGGGGPEGWGRDTEPLPRGTHNLPERRTVRWVPALRHDVDWVEETLAGRSGLRTAVLCGPAGSDKTTVALEYAHRHLRDHTLVWWIDAREPGGVESGVASIAHTLLPESASGPTGADAAGRALRWLESHPGWLLVLDHVTDAGKVTELRDRVGAYGHLLVTARAHAREWAALPVRDLTSAHRGRHDPLTGLRTELTLRAQMSGLLCADAGADDAGPHHTHLRAPSKDPDTGQRGLAVLLCSLDGLESVNDRFGRAAGDAVLVEVARRLREAVRDDDTVARVGDDEFAVLAGGLDRAGATNLAVRLRGEVVPPIRVEGGAVRVGASTAVAWARCGSAPERIIDSARREVLGRARGLSLLLRLTEALCALTCMEEAPGRASFAHVLAEQLGRPIDLRGARLREDVVTLVRAALSTAGGEHVLADVVRILEGVPAADEV